MIDLSFPDAGLALLTLDRPTAANSLTVSAVEQLRRLISVAEDRKDVRVLILAGQGANFCAGLDLNSIAPGMSHMRGPIDHMVLQEQFSGVVQALSKSRLPVIAALHGAIVGAGMGIALAADVRVADPTARFLVGAVKLGLSAGECGISYHLPRIVGSGRAAEIMLTGRLVDAEEAWRIGMVNRMSDEGEVLQLALGVAREMLALSPYSIKHSKQVMRANLAAPSLDAALELENHVQCLALSTNDFNEARTAFSEKRPPRFTGS